MVGDGSARVDEGAIVIRGVAVPSRYFLAPINTGFASRGQPTRDLVEFHRIRAGSRIGIAYVGNVSIGPEYVTNAGTLWLNQNSGAPWTELVGAIEERQSVPAIQLAARLSNRAALRRWRPERPEQTLLEIQSEFVSVPAAKLLEVVDAFGKASAVAAGLRFKAIQIHAAHGYLLSQSLNAEVNVRGDEFGDRSELLLRVVRVVREKAKDVILDVRISLSDCTAQWMEELIPRLVREGVDLVSVSSGSYEGSRALIYPGRRDGEGVYVADAVALSTSWPELWWNVAGNVREIPVVACPQNLTFSLGRSLIADPAFVLKRLSGRSNTVQSCRWHGKCHYYTRGTDHIECPESPDLANITPGSPSGRVR